MFNVVKSYFGFGPPGEVHNNEVAPYKVLEKFEGYELIEYPEQKWVSTIASGPKNNAMFMKLFGYITGKNANGDKISMTVPVMTSNQKEEGGMKREMQFFIPTDFQESPPNPNDADVTVITRPAMIMYSKFLSGFPNFEQEALKFRGELEAAGHTNADFNIFYSAGWDAPFKLLNRRNEIMFRKVDSTDASPSAAKEADKSPAKADKPPAVSDTPSADAQ